MKDLKFISPFKKLCITIGNLPTAYIESMSYYEGLTFLVNYLANNVIPAVNNNSEVVKELQEQFVILKEYVDNYFENLDVQEEINNKLDEMADEGVLTDIIAQYLGLAGLLTFNTVADMKAGVNLANGSTVQTLGYYAINDGGKAYYKVREIINTDAIDEMKLIALSDPSLVAELQIEDEMLPEQFGAHGDGTNDDTTALQTCLDNCNNAQLKGVYLVNSTINIDNNIYMDGNSYIKAGSALTVLVSVAKNSQKVGREYHINVDCDGIVNTGIAVGKPRKCRFFMNVINAGSTGISCNYYTSNANNENEFTCNVVGNSSGTTVRGVMCNCYDSIFHSIACQDCQRGVEINAGELIATSVHAWISQAMANTLWSGSCVVYNAGNYLQMIDWLYQDSTQYGVLATGAYGNIKYFEYYISLTDDPQYANFVNVKNSNSSIRLTIDYFKNAKTEAQLLKYDIGTANYSEFGVLVKNGVTTVTGQIEPYQPFNDCDYAPQWGGFWVLWDTANVPTGINGYLQCEIVGNMAKQTYICNRQNLDDVPRFWIRVRQLGSDTWSGWKKATLTT